MSFELMAAIEAVVLESLQENEGIEITKRVAGSHDYSYEGITGKFILTINTQDGSNPYIEYTTYFDNIDDRPGLFVPITKRVDPWLLRQAFTLDGVIKNAIANIGNNIGRTIWSIITDYVAQYKARKYLIQNIATGYFMTKIQPFGALDKDRAEAEMEIYNLILLGWQVMSVEMSATGEERYVHLTRTKTSVSGS